MITHFVNYYGQYDRALEIYENWDEFPLGFKTMIVDDGHPTMAPITSYQPSRMVRIMKDIPWNMPGAINLAAAIADTEWIFHTDMDVDVKCADARNVKELTEVKEDTAFFFSLTLPWNKERYDGVSFFLMRTSTFWKAGGYDEDFSGHYGSDDNHFYQRVKALVPTVRPEFTFKHNHIEGSEKTIRDIEVNSKLLLSRPLTNVCNNPIRFPFEVIR